VGGDGLYRAEVEFDADVSGDELADTVARKVGQDVDARLSRIEDRLDELEGGRL